MWKGKVFKTFAVFLLSLPLFGEDIIYTPKVFFDTTKPSQSLKAYPKATAQFLSAVDKELREKITRHLLKRGAILLFKSGIGSDLTVFYTFPQAYLYKLSVKREEGTATYWRYGYTADISLALYVFKTSSNPRLIFYKTYRFNRYRPPQGESLPLSIQLARQVASSLYRQLEADLDRVIEEEKKRLEYYKNLGKAQSPKR
jgi:hypothetical protein